MKKILSAILIFVLFVSTFSICANATAREVKDTGGGAILATNGNIGSKDGKNEANVSYAKRWELYAYYDSGESIIRFGFDTWATNEDYVYGWNKSYAHQATVENSVERVESSAQAAKGKWTSKVYIKHAARPIWKLLY